MQDILPFAAMLCLSTVSNIECSLPEVLIAVVVLPNLFFPFAVIVPGLYESTHL